MKPLISIVAVAALSAYSLVSSAGPDKTTKLLMDTQASIFDLGQIRLTTYLHRAFQRNGSPMSVGVDYSWDDDKIAVSLSKFGYEGSKGAARNSCLEGFATLRVGAGIETGTSHIYDFLDMSFWEQQFTHVDYDQGGLQKNIRGKLDKKFVLKCTVFFEDQSKDMLQIQSPLLSTSYSEISN